MPRLTLILISFCFSSLIFSLLAFNVYAEKLPIEAFGKLPGSQQVKLSPDGNKVAFINNVAGNTMIGVTDLEKYTTKYLVRTDNQKFKIGWYLWANNELLLVSADYPVQRRGLKYTEARLLKVHVDGKEAFDSVIKLRKGDNSPQFQNNIIDLLPGEPNHILMALDLKVSNRPDVYKINLTNNRKRKRIYRGKSHVYNWMTDQQHKLRLGFGRDETKIFYRLFDIKKDEWRNIWEYEIFDAPDLSPLGFGLNPDDLYIRADHNGRYAIFKVDVSKAELPRELVFSDPDYDVEGSLIYSQKTNDVIGVYHGEADNAKVFFDPVYDAFQTALNTALPDAYNNVSSFSADERKYILYTSKSQSPGAYYLGDRDTNDLTFVLEQYPLLYQQKLSGKNKISYKARDGVAIEGYISKPHTNVKNTKGAIILPHGGPMVRNYAGFDWFSEFFASRGYTVLEPNFRGSSGYGFKFEMEAVQKWGGAMQDDLADAAKWMVKEYDIDKNKVCILGGSYGGYAALMAAVKQQDVFKCAASFAGVSDLALIVSKARRFTNNEVVKKQFGTDSDVLEHNSPVNFAKDINIPVLLIHGDKDRVVDVRHSRDMHEELQDYKKEVEYIELENGNHYMEIEAHRMTVLTSLEAFLQKHIGAD
ncbi:MAG: dipeptidyl aminopeptidase/acylaminoacyl peptidase [Colwellia sp.]|jgi:dipeptidyl aminopeptidase/acylaminoacyl peptidase